MTEGIGSPVKTRMGHDMTDTTFSFGAPVPAFTPPAPVADLAIARDATVTPDERAAFVAHIADLTSQNSRLDTTLQSVRETLTAREIAHREDIRKIGEALISEAEARDWCSEYDTFVDDINSSLSEELPVRQREYLVEAQITVRVRVTARDEEGATEEARSILERAESAAYNVYEVENTDLDSDYQWSVEQG